MRTTALDGHAVRIALGIVLALLAAFALPASSRACGSTAARPHDRAGSHALQFRIDRNFTLGSFQGAFVSYQRFVTNDVAFRIGASLSADFENETIGSEFPGYESLSGEGDVTDWDHEYTVVGQLLKYWQSGPVEFYFGGGPEATLMDYRNEHIRFSPDGGELEVRYSKTTSQSWSVGLAGVVGVQWAFGGSFALHAEYGATLEYRRSSQRSEYRVSDLPQYDEISTTKSSSPQFGSNGVLLGLSVYF